MNHVQLPNHHSILLAQRKSPYAIEMTLAKSTGLFVSPNITLQNSTWLSGVTAAVLKI